MYLWAVTVSHSSVPCESHYTYCSHHSLRSPSSFRGGNHSRWLVKPAKPLMAGSAPPHADYLGRGRQTETQQWNYKKKKKKNIKWVQMILQVLLMGAVLGFLGVLEEPCCKHVTSPAVMALTNCFTHRSDKRQSTALYNSLAVHSLFIYLLRHQLHFKNR